MPANSLISHIVLRTVSLRQTSDKSGLSHYFVSYELLTLIQLTISPQFLNTRRFPGNLEITQTASIELVPFSFNFFHFHLLPTSFLFFFSPLSALNHRIPPRKAEQLRFQAWWIHPVDPTYLFAFLHFCNFGNFLYFALSPWRLNSFFFPFSTLTFFSQLSILTSFVLTLLQHTFNYGPYA